MNTWMIGFIIYQLIGWWIVGVIAGSCKVHGWKFHYLKQQLSMEGICSLIFWEIFSLFWLPLLVVLFTKAAYYSIMEKRK